MNQPGKYFIKILHRHLNQKDPKVLKMDQMTQFESLSVQNEPIIFSFKSPLNTSSVFDSIVSNIGSKNIEIRTGDYSDPQEYFYSRQYKKSTLTKYIKMIENKIQNKKLPPYAGNIQLTPREFKSLNWVVPKFIKIEQSGKIGLWIGKTGSITPLHKDTTDNFAFHFIGKKRWTLLPPRDSLNFKMIPFSAQEDSEFCSPLIDLNRSNLNELINITPLVCEVHRGQALFVPAGWLHYVEHLEDSVMLNIWDQPSKLPRSLT